MNIWRFTIMSMPNWTKLEKKQWEQIPSNFFAILFIIKIEKFKY